MKAIENYFHAVLFVLLYKEVLTFESVDETLAFSHSNESYWELLSWGTVYYAVQDGSSFQVCGWIPSVYPFKWKLLSSTFMWYLLIMPYREVLNFNDSLNETLMCDHSSESNWEELSFSANCSWILSISREEASAVLTYNHQEKQNQQLWHSIYSLSSNKAGYL